MEEGLCTQGKRWMKRKLWKRTAGEHACAWGNWNPSNFAHQPFQQLWAKLALLLNPVCKGGRHAGDHWWNDKPNWAVCWVSFIFAIKWSSLSLLFTVHFTATSERARLCWDDHWEGSVVACSSGMSESSWVSPTAFRHSLNCFPQAHLFTLLWHGREQRERSDQKWQTRWMGELIYRGKYSFCKLRTKRIRALQSVLRLLVYPRERSQESRWVLEGWFGVPMSSPTVASSGSCIYLAGPQKLNFKSGNLSSLKSVDNLHITFLFPRKVIVLLFSWLHNNLRKPAGYIL